AALRIRRSTGRTRPVVDRLRPCRWRGTCRHAAAGHPTEKAPPSPAHQIRRRSVGCRGPGGMSRAFVALGSNLNSPAHQIMKAFDELDAIPRTEVVQRSSLYRTAPLGY